MIRQTDRTTGIRKGLRDMVSKALWNDQQMEKNRADMEKAFAAGRLEEAIGLSASMDQIQLRMLQTEIAEAS